MKSGESAGNLVSDAGSILTADGEEGVATLIAFEGVSGGFAAPELGARAEHAQELFEYDCHGRSACGFAGVDCQRVYDPPKCHGFLRFWAAPLVVAGSGGREAAIAFGMQVGLYDHRYTR